MRRIFAVCGSAILGLASMAGTATADEALAEKIELCTSCHGEKGIPEDKEVPVIWGQHYYYLYVQLRDYKAGRRENEIMQGIVVELTKDDMKALAQHFSEKTWPEISYKSDSEKAAIGQTAASAGQCPQCHLGGYEGNSRVPYMRGQSVTYLEKTMMEFKNRVRMNSPAKASLMDSFTEEQVKGIAEYIAGL